MNGGDGISSPSPLVASREEATTTRIRVCRTLAKLRDYWQTLLVSGLAGARRGSDVVITAVP